MGLKLAELSTWYLDDEVDLDRNLDGDYELEDGGELFFDDLFGYTHEIKFATEGVRISPEISLTPVGRYESSIITWEGEFLEDIKVYVSIDNEEFQEASNEGSIPQLSGGDNLEGATLRTKQVLTTEDVDKSPQLDSLTLTINSEDEEYKMYTLRDNQPFINAEKVEGNLNAILEIIESKVVLKGENKFDELLIKDIS